MPWDKTPWLRKHRLTGDKRHGHCSIYIVLKSHQLLGTPGEDYVGRKEEEAGHTAVVVAVLRRSRLGLRSRWRRGRGLWGRFRGFALMRVGGIGMVVGRWWFGVWSLCLLAVTVIVERWHQLRRSCPLVLLLRGLAGGALIPEIVSSGISRLCCLLRALAAGLLLPPSHHLRFLAVVLASALLLVSVRSVVAALAFACSLLLLDPAIFALRSSGRVIRVDIVT